MTNGMLINILLVALLMIFYYIYHKYSYWSSRGIPGPRAIFPFGCTILRVLYPAHEFELKWLNQYGKVYGVYIGLKPVLTVAEPELIKQIMVTDFNLFTNRTHLNSYHEWWNTSLCMAKGQDWVRLRSVVGHVFNLEMLRDSVPLMQKSIKKMCNFIDRIIENNFDGEGFIVPKVLFSELTVDVIALTVFATEINANDGTCPDALLENGLNFMNLNPLKIALMHILPRYILNCIGFTQPIKPESFDYFVGLAERIATKRQTAKSQSRVNTRNDLIQHLIDSFVNEKQLNDLSYAKLSAPLDSESTLNEQIGNCNKSLTKNEIITQCIAFLSSGVETNAETLANCIFELMKNAEVQQNLFTEVDQVLSNLKEGDSKDDAILGKMNYLEAVIKETLRKYPPVVRLERRVGIDGYKLGALSLEKGTLVQVPPCAVHYCSDYYPEPNRFNPERFMPQNVHSIKPYTFIPFGVGPRNCVAIQFAFQTMKLCLATIVQRYRFNDIADTPDELAFHPAICTLNAKLFFCKVIRR